jgi:addiction module HigA family antidote
MSISKAKTTPAADRRPRTSAPAPLRDRKQPPAHPGEVFREDFRLLQDPPVSQAEAARRLGWTTNRLNEFELGKRALTIANAIALEALTGASAEFWWNLQANYDLWHGYKAASKVKRVIPGQPFVFAEHAGK